MIPVSSVSLLTSCHDDVVDSAKQKYYLKLAQVLSSWQLSKLHPVRRKEGCGWNSLKTLIVEWSFFFFVKALFQRPKTFMPEHFPVQDCGLYFSSLTDTYALLKPDSYTIHISNYSLPYVMQRYDRLSHKRELLNWRGEINKHNPSLPLSYMSPTPPRLR